LWAWRVADGVGGHAAGDIASATIAIRLASMLDATEGRVPDEARLRELVAVANADLALRVRMDSALQGMATTLVGLFFDGERVLVAHTGDSRAYRLRDGAFEQVTKDDSLVHELLASGAIAEAEASQHPLRSVVTCLPAPAALRGARVRGRQPPALGVLVARGRRDDSDQADMAAYAATPTPSLSDLDAERIRIEIAYRA